MDTTKPTKGLWQPPAGTPIFLEEPDYIRVETADEDGGKGWLPSGFIEWFVVAQTAIPAMLYLPGSQAYRLPIRIGAYAMALLAFSVWWFDRGGKRVGRRHPAEPWLLLVLLLLILMIFHPLTNSILSGTAQTTLYFTIFSAVFWSSGFVDDPKELRRILAILLVCNGINALVGVLQVYDPDRWMPRELSFAFAPNSSALWASSFVGPNGRILIRPPGLYDTPGAVCGAGTTAALLGVIFALEPRKWWERLGALFFGFAGVAAIYLSHVRVNLVVLLMMMVIYTAILALHDRKAKAITFGATCAGLLTLGLLAAVVLGGEGVRDRFLTLLADDPTTVYYQNRGAGMQAGFAEIADKYPLGAGLARWGTMRGYFGNSANLDSTELFAEVQPNAWMLDGGYFLLGLYGMALIVTFAYDVKIARAKHFKPDDHAWIAAIVATNIGTMAMVFTFVPFATQMGLQFWFLEGVLHGAVVKRLRE
jgi:hypothetical protein